MELTKKEWDQPPKQHRFLQWVEKVGNKFPQPFLLFIICSLVLLVIAQAMEGTTFTIPGEGREMEIVSLLNRDGFVYIISHMLTNFINFPLIPLIVIFTLAIGVGDKAGLYHVLILKFFRRIPDWALYFVFLFVSINGNIISDAALILLPSIGAILFSSKGKNPILAVMMGYAGYLAGLSANTIIAGTDVLMSGITQSVLPFLEITENVAIHPACNWFFMGVSSILLPLAGTYITIRFVEPLANSDPSIKWSTATEEEKAATFSLTQEQRRGLRFAAWTSVVYLALVLLLVLLPNGWLRNAEDGSILPKSPFIDNITVILAIFFFLVGLMYGIGAKTLRSSLDVSNAMVSGLSTITGLLVVFFFAAQFVDYFNQTNLAPYLAIQGAEFLQRCNFTGIPFLVVIIFITAFLNFFVGTVGSKWSMMAPVLVPMFALLGYHPAFAQCVYRIGDAVTNTINPISVYIPIILMYLKQYKKDAGVGTIVMYQLPYAGMFTVTWILQMIVWYVFDLPLGPMASIWLS